MGRHAGFHRLVVDLTQAVPDYSAVAAGARSFVITLPGARLGPAGAEGLGKAGVAGYGLSADGDAGALRLTLSSPAPALIRRTFVIAPARAGSPWRLVIDLAPGPDSGKGLAGRNRVPSHGGATRAGALDLPSMHGMMPVPAAPPVEVSWARASRILKELQARAIPDASRPAPPQLVLPEKYRQDTVPLR